MRSAGLGRPVEVPVRGLHQSRVRVRAVFNVKAVQRSQRSLRSHFEDGAFIVCASCFGCPVKVPVITQHKPGERGRAIGAALTAKAMKGGERSGWSNLEHRALLMGSSGLGGSVQISVCPLGKGREERVGSVRSDEIGQSRKSLRAPHLQRRQAEESEEQARKREKIHEFMLRPNQICRKRFLVTTLLPGDPEIAITSGFSI